MRTERPCGPRPLIILSGLNEIDELRCLRVDALSPSRARGAFAGISLDGSTLRPDERGNHKLTSTASGHRKYVGQALGNNLDSLNRFICRGLRVQNFPNNSFFILRWKFETVVRWCLQAGFSATTGK
jgi:hypothetical protein